jgi:NAD-dependent SIR2 family protein deacetylase
MAGENGEPIDVLSLKRHRNIVVMTGAGISVASGIPPFRGPGGLWNDPEMEKLAFPQILTDDPVSAWKFYSNLRKIAQEAKPNAAHKALANFEKHLHDQNVLLITQNVDGVHRKAGNKNVVEMYGSIRRTRCSNSECSFLPFKDDRIYSEPPRCPQCGSVLRPDVILFGEFLHPENIAVVTKTVHECDLFIAVGTSGIVHRANFVRTAGNAEARTIYVNLEPLEAPDDFDQMILGKAEEVLPWLMSEVVDWYDFRDIKTLSSMFASDNLRKLIDQMRKHPWSERLLFQEGVNQSVHITLNRRNILTLSVRLTNEPRPYAVGKPDTAYTVLVHGKQFGPLSIAALMKALQSWLSHQGVVEKITSPTGVAGATGPN